MKKLFKRRKKSLGDVTSLASGRSASGYSISPKKDLQKLHKAAFDDDIAKLKTLLKKGDVNQLDKENRTPLHLACAQGNVETVQILVNHPQCNLNLCDNDRRSALMKCVQCQFQNCLEILINKRADVNLSDINGNTALHLASAIPSIDACCLLLDSNADVSHKNKEGTTPLHIASSTEGAENVINCLIEDGAQVNATDNSGKTPLMHAASRGHLDIVRILLTHKADASIKDLKGWSADDYASMNGHHPISMIIFEHSQTQQKQKTYQPSMGDHIYATVKKKPSVQPQATPSHDDDDLSLSESSSPSLLSSEEAKNNFLSKEQAPVVNVAAFMKKRQLMKNSIPEASEEEAGDSPDVDFAKKKIDFAAHSDEDEKTNPDVNEGFKSGVRFRGDESNSRKGGPVSSSKPPLPGNHPSGELFSGDGVNLDIDDDSPWDDEDDDLPPAMPTSTNQYNKPSQDVISSLGFTDKEIDRIYERSSDESTSRDLDLSVEKNEARDEIANEASKPANDDGDDNDLSSAWDDDEVSEKVSSKNHNNFFATSSLKFDDELSVSSLVSSRNDLQDKGVLFDSEHDSDTFDSVKTEKKISPTPTALTSPTKIKQPNAVNTLTAFEKVSDVDESTDEDTLESESDWERENRLRREEFKNQNQSYVEDEKNQSDLDSVESLPLETKKKQQKSLAVEAAAAAKIRVENRRKKEEEKKKEEEEDHLELLASQDRRKIEAALQDALEGSTEASTSEGSELDEHLMGNTDSYAKKMADAGVLSVPSSKKGRKAKMYNGKHGRPYMNGMDPETWTGTETESDIEDDYRGTITASLRSSQLSEALIRSGERGELEREAARAKRKVIDAVEQAEFARRDVAMLRDQIEEYKIHEEEWEGVRSDMEANIRELKFDKSRLSEQLESIRLDLKTSNERNNRLVENLGIESDTRRKRESTILDLENEMKISEQQLKQLESDKQQLMTRLQQSTTDDALSRDQTRIQRDLEEEESNQSRQFEALNLLLQEKDQELIRLKAERDSLEEAVDRYKDEVRRWNSGGDNNTQIVMELNNELNTKVQELDSCVKEREENLKQVTMQYNMEINLIKQANESVIGQMKKEQIEKANAVRDLDILNQQQIILKQKIDETEELLRKEGNKSASLEGELKGVREQKESLEKRLHGFEVNENTSLQEASNLRTVLTHKESSLSHVQRENQEHRERVRNIETDLNESRRENAKLLGRIEMLQADVSQQESERIRLRRDLDEARSLNSATLNSQHGKLSEIMTGTHTLLNQHIDQLVSVLTPSNSITSTSQTERIELEKMNAQLKQQVTYFKEEINKMGEDRFKKEEELALAQQDRIETHKRLSFTESSMAQLTESQQKLQQDKQNLSVELEASKARCLSLESRITEAHQQVESLSDQLSNERETSSATRRDMQSLETNRIQDKDKILRLENNLKEAELETERLKSELGSFTHRERDARDDREIMRRSKQQLEELVAKLQDEKVEAEEKMKSEMQRCQMLESEASGHRRMWEEEVRARSKLSVELARVDQDRRDAIELLNSYKDKYSRASLQSKSYRSKYENGKKRSSKMEHQLDEYSRKAAENKARYDSSGSECDSRLSLLSEEHERERSRLEDTVNNLQARIVTLDQKLKQEKQKRTAAERQLQTQETSTKDIGGSVTELEQERVQLRDELNRLRKSHADQSRVSMSANAQVNAKLEQVNAWLEERSVAQEILEKLRFDNEEKRVAEATRRADMLQRELDILRSSQPNIHEEKVKIDVEELRREKIDLHEKLIKSKHDIEEYKLKLEHEKKKSANFRSNAFSAAIAGSIGNGLNSPSHLSNSLPNHSSLDILSSTPRREATDPVLAQLRHKLDASIALRLSSPPPSKTDISGSNRSKPVLNEYFIP